VFVSLDPALLRGWETRDAVRSRAARIDDNYDQRAKRVGTVPDRTISPRLLAVHTLAHALITEWSLDSGYPTSSLRERLYVDEAMAAFLIYTATSDSAGSLGGVVAQARPASLSASVRAAVRRAAWCSADPLCVEAEATGVDSLNLAACHACALLPEVSCEEMNVLLDRAMLVGTPDDPGIGLLAHLTE
jgi:acyl-CoA synthetase (AMP-forming)/AMP-acid ligase II